MHDVIMQPSTKIHAATSSVAMKNWYTDVKLSVTYIAIWIRTNSSKYNTILNKNNIFLQQKEIVNCNEIK